MGHRVPQPVFPTVYAERIVGCLHTLRARLRGEVSRNTGEECVAEDGGGGWRSDNAMPKYPEGDSLL